MPRLFHNLLPSRLSQELEAARRVLVDPFMIPSDAFDALAAQGAQMIYVVLPDCRLVAAPRSQRGEFISHAVLATGGPVLAAGEFQMNIDDTAMAVSKLDNMSGHYQPGSATLALARTAFEAAGIDVRPDGLRPYDWEAP